MNAIELTNGAHNPLLTTEHPQSRVFHVSEWMREIRGKGPTIRLHTGIPSLDGACRGGIPVPRLVVVAGPPGAGKTSFVVAMAHRMASAGMSTAIHAIDEGIKGALFRLAQIEGCDVERLEKDNHEEWQKAESLVGRLPIIMADETSTFETVACELSAFADGRPAVFVADSVQTMPFDSLRASKGKLEKRERVIQAVETVKSHTMQLDFLTFLTSEVTRAVYRSRDPKEQVNDMAAFKESGDIEYALETGLVFRSVEGTPNLFDVTTPKNRGFRFGRPKFRLRMHDRATFDEVPIDNVTADESTSGNALQRGKRAVILVLKGRQDLKSKRKIYQQIQESKIDAPSKPTVFKAIDSLEEDDLVTTFEGAFRLSSEVKE